MCDEVGAGGVGEEVECGGEECGVVDDVLCVEARGEDGAGATAEVIDELRELGLEVTHELGEVHEGGADDEVEVVGEEDEGKDLDVEAGLRGGEELEDGVREEVGLSRGEEEAGVEATVGDEVDGVGVLDADGSGHVRSPECDANCEGEVACQECCRHSF